ncbi:MAG: cytochrome c biogenesis protein ResB, partial [Planctomycetota bacterium]
WKALGSAKLAIVLMTAIVLASIAGTLCPPDKAGEMVFGTWWFRGGMALLCVNIVACTLSRGRVTMLRLGSFLAHISILLILGGAIYGGFQGEKGTLALMVGETSDTVPVDENQAFPLGFLVRLDDFHVERDCKEVTPRLTVLDPQGAELAKVDVKDGITSTIAPYQFTILRYYPDFVIGEGGPISKTSYPNNPAVEVLVTGTQGENKRWVFAKYPEYGESHGGADNALAFALEAGESGRIKQFKSRLTFIEGGRDVRSDEIWVNHPARYKGYTFYQSSYDQEQESWSGLQVVKDPGVPIVYGGFAVQIAGVVLIIFLNPILRERLRAGRTA